MALIPTQRLDKRLEILTFTKTKNEYFEWVETWTTERKVWGSVKQQYFRDYQETFGTTLQNTTNFIVRYETGKYFDNSKRILLDGRTYAIEDILEGSYARDFTTIIAKEVSSSNG